MRDYKKELEGRIRYIRDVVKKSGAAGIVFGNSGGKDSALVGILCKMACDNTIGIMMPCESKRNFGEDMEDGGEVAAKFGIENRTLDLTEAKSVMRGIVGDVTKLSDMAVQNIAPRLRMISLYAIAASENRVVAGTGNRSEIYMGYFTKWGDGAYDFNPIADLTVSEIYEFLEYLGAPSNIIEKAPSGGLFEGQTDEAEMGVTYKSIDSFLLSGTAPEEDLKIIERYHARSGHKRQMPGVYEEK